MTILAQTKFWMYSGSGGETDTCLALDSRKSYGIFSAQPDDWGSFARWLYVSRSGMCIQGKEKAK